MLFAIFTKYVKVTETHSGNSHGHIRGIHTCPATAYRLHSFIFLPVQNRLEIGLFSGKPDGVICTLEL
jgi:hypothetical protein